jgi:glycosyltransferase involved in cell wall biosynthesis
MKKSIFLPLITYGGTCQTEFAVATMGLILQIQRYKDIDMVISPITFESLISRARNAAAAWALSRDYTHLLFIDADISFDPADVFRLIVADKDVVVGIYPKKYYNRTKMETLANDFPQVFNDKEDWRALATDFSTEFNAEGLKKAKQGEAFEVDYAATGFMLIKTDVFKKIIDKRPDLKYINDVDGYMSADKDNFYDFFQVGVNPSSKKYESEDYGFCQLWRSLGGKIHVLPEIKLTHTGRIHYPGDIKAQANLF